MSEVAEKLESSWAEKAWFKNPRGHVWKKDEDGDFDAFAHETEGRYCNGPECVNCGLSFCHHCHGDWPLEECAAARIRESKP
jgi:hypothetical protein